MSSTRLMVLGAVRRRGRVHGYHIYQDLSNWSAEEWTNIKIGSIYHALKQLEREGLLKAISTEDSKLGPRRTKYDLTEAGEIEFFKMLETALQSTDLGSLAAGLAFMEVLPRRRVVTLLRKNLSQQLTIHSFLRKLPTSPEPPDPSQHPELVGLWLNHHTTCVNALKGMIRRINGGSYIFSEEPHPKEHHF